MYVLASQMTRSSGRMEAIALAQAGRVDFFKQALTLSLAGMAGLAALLSSDKHFPKGSLEIASTSIVGLLLLATAAASLMGLSTYANLLILADRQQSTAAYLEGMGNHARVCFLLLALAALSVAFFAGVMLFSPKPSEASDPPRTERVSYLDEAGDLQMVLFHCPHLSDERQEEREEGKVIATCHEVRLNLGEVSNRR